MSYAAFKASVLGKKIGDGECVSLVVNNSKAYTEYLFPGISWTSVFKPVPSAKDLLNDANAKYFEKITNDHADVNQLPKQGDVMVFGATPASGYTNTFDNPDGHCGVCESATSEGYALLQQNSPSTGSPVNVKEYPWNFRPCLGWLRPVAQPAPKPTAAPIDIVKPVVTTPAKVTTTVSPIVTANTTPVATTGVVTLTTPLTNTQVVTPTPSKGDFMSKYNKVLIAFAGSAITWLTVHYGSNAVVQDVVMAATVLGVYQTPNKQD